MVRDVKWKNRMQRARNVAETKTLRWTSRVTREDKINGMEMDTLGLVWTLFRWWIEIKRQPGWFERIMKKDKGKSDDTNNGRRRNRRQEKGRKRNF